MPKCPSIKLVAISTAAGAGLYLAGFDAAFTFFGIASSECTLLTLISIMGTAATCGLLSGPVINLVANRLGFFTTRYPRANDKTHTDSITEAKVDNIIYAKQYYDRRRGMYYFQLTREQQNELAANPDAIITPIC